VFATEFGGVAEIIQDGDNGFYINPTDFGATTEKILTFLNQSDTDPQLWHRVSQRAIQRIDRLCNWETHVRQLLLFARVYGFWDYVSRNSREALHCYLDALFHLLYKPRAAKILDQHWQR
jgi:sucrose synthase